MGLLKFSLRWSLKLVLPIIIIAGILFYYGQGLQNASLERFELTGIDGITTESFTLVGNLFVKNPSDLSIPVESIGYEIFLKDTGEKIGSGNLPEFTLEKSKVSKIPFNQEIEWVPSIKLAADLLTKDKVLITVKGKARINLPKVKEYVIPFSAETDIKEYVGQFVSSPLSLDEDLPLIENSDDSLISDEPLGILK